MMSLKQARRERVVLERQAISLFRMLLKSERGRSGSGAHLMPPKEREAVARRVDVIDGEIRKLRRAVRKIGAGK
jgi:hypothetical protein